MDQLIENFPAQLKEALQIGREAKLSSATQEIKQVLISGLGGSGIGGDLTRQFSQNNATLPIASNKDYLLPNYVNEHTLLIISSYSGNTEETISAMEDGIKKKAQVVCVTSNGRVRELATANGFDQISIPGGMPPRACLGYSLVQQLFIFDHFGITHYDFQKELEESITLLEKEQEDIKSIAKDFAGKIPDKLPIIYTASDFEAVGVRFRQQLNENSKMLAWHHVLPEMNHNELVGWRTKNEDLAVIMLRHGQEHAQVQRRFEICKNIWAQYTDSIHELTAKGTSSIQNSFYLIHLCDWISYYLAGVRSVDPMEVDVIDHLKNELGNTTVE